MLKCHISTPHHDSLKMWDQILNEWKMRVPVKRRDRPDGWCGDWGGQRLPKGKQHGGTPEPERIINCRRDVLIAKKKHMRWRRINLYLKTTQGFQHKSVNFACERITSRLIYKVFISTLALLAGYHGIIAHLCQEYSYLQTNFVKRSKKCWAKSWLDQTPSTSPPFSESGISEWNIFANRYITAKEIYSANKLQIMYSYCMSCLSAIHTVGDVWFSDCLIMSVTLADCAAMF